MQGMLTLPFGGKVIWKLGSSLIFYLLILYFFGAKEAAKRLESVFENIQRIRRKKLLKETPFSIMKTTDYATSKCETETSQFEIESLATEDELHCQSYYIERICYLSLLVINYKKEKIVKKGIYLSILE